jgi:hypothetical protein
VTLPRRGELCRRRPDAVSPCRRYRRRRRREWRQRRHPHRCKQQHHHHQQQQRRHPHHPHFYDQLAVGVPFILVLWGRVVPRKFWDLGPLGVYPKPVRTLHGSALTANMRMRIVPTVSVPCVDFGDDRRLRTGTRQCRPRRWRRRMNVWTTPGRQDC